jgi:signal transduction histidine kinase
MPGYDLITSTIITAGGMYLFIAMLALVWKSPQPSAARALALYAVSAALWSLTQLAWLWGWFPFLMDPFLARLPLYGLLFSSVFFLYFLEIFLHIDGWGWFWWLLGIFWVGALLVVEANPLLLPGVLFSRMGWSYSHQDFLRNALVAGWGLFTGKAALLTIQAYRKVQHPSRRNRIKYLAPALCLVLLGDTIFLAAYWPLGDMIHLVGIILAAYAVLLKRLPAIRQAFLRSISYLISTGLLVLLYTGVLLIALRIFNAAAGFIEWVVGGIMAVFLAVVFTPFLRRVQNLIERMVAGVGRNPSYILRQYSQGISNILDLKRLAAVAVESLSETMEVQSGYLFLVDQERDEEGESCYHLQGVNGGEGEDPPPCFISQESPVAEFFRSEHRSLTQYDVDNSPRFLAIPPEERSWMVELAADVYIPIYAKGEWIGLLALGPKLSGVPFVDGDLDLLSTLADQTAVALENARLVEGLMRLNSDFRRANAALDQANRQLERLDRTKTDFISIASHELLTPLTVVSGYSQMLYDDPALHANASYAKMIDGIQGGSKRLHEIVDSMLDMAKIDARDFQIDPEPVSILEIIKSLRKELNDAIVERQQKLEIADLDSLPAIEADPDALRKVFYHLLVNAVKYTPDNGKIRVTGKALLPSPVDLPQGGVEIIVSDNGVGIDPRLSELIFVKFYQTGELDLHSTGRTKFKGSGPGLGLAITKGIVEAHGGKIWVESPGYNEAKCPGSQFHIVLPLRQTSIEKASLPTFAAR